MITHASSCILRTCCCPGSYPDLPTSRRPARRPYARVSRPTLDRECARAGVFAAESGSPKSATPFSRAVSLPLPLAFAIPRRETRRRVKATRPSPRARPRRRAALRLPPPPKTARESRQRRTLYSPPSHHFLAFAASRASTLIKGAMKGARTTLLPWLRHTQTRSRPTFITHTRHTNVLLPSLSLPLSLCSFSTQSLLPPLLS